MMLSIFLLILAVVILYFGAEFSLDASEKVGKRLGLSPLMIGMLLVGFGTSLPEFFVGHIAGVQGKAGIAVGSLVGSNIANLLLILGVSGFFVQLKVSDISLRKQLIIHLLLGGVLFFVLNQSELNILTASPLVILCGVYLYVLFLELKNNQGSDSKDESDFKPHIVLVKLFGGFGMLYLGGELLVKSGSDLCLYLGMTEYVVSAIFIAFGTSFPELVTSILAAVKKKDSELIVGNIVGSNLFNCAFILGSLGIYNFSLEGNYNFELLNLGIGSFILLFLSYTKLNFGKVTSIFFFAGYGVMVSYWLGLIKVGV